MASGGRRMRWGWLAIAAGCGIGIGSGVGACGGGDDADTGGSADGGGVSAGGSPASGSGVGGAAAGPLGCTVDAPLSAPPAVSGPYFTEVTAEAGIGAFTAGFGRVMVVDIDADGFDDIVGTPAHDGQHGLPDAFAKVVLRNRGDGTFEDFTEASGLAPVRAGLMLFGDVDNDGDQDMYAGVIESVGLEDQGIWRNDGTGRFTHDGAAGTEASQLSCGGQTCTERQIAGSFADFNGDGVLDLYLGGWFWSDGISDQRYNPPPRDDVYFGVGDGTFTAATLPPHAHPETGTTSANLGRAAMGTAVGDYDGDGDLDVFVANYGAGRPVGPLAEPLCQPPRYWDQNLLWRNEGNGSFVDVSDEAGVAATMRGPDGVTAEPPLTIGNECPEEVRGSYPAPVGGNNFTPVWGDFDNDGDLDLLVGSIAHPDYPQSDPTSLFINQGAPNFNFVDEADVRGLDYREDEKHVAFVDADHDGFLDVATTGFRSENAWRLYLQEAGQLTLLDAATTGVDDQHQETMVWLDYDRDGDLDLYIAEDVGPGRLFRNDAANARRHLTITLDGAGAGPRDATGARVTLEGTAGRQLREVPGPGGHYNVQASRTLYFGLGGDACALDVNVRWPDGTVTALGDLAADQQLVVAADGTVASR
ncbi:MAG: CRTAC1 family protein [Myxococcota bacterium]